MGRHRRTERSAAVGPGREQLDFDGSQASIIEKISESARRRPRRHPTLQDLFSNRSCPLARFVVGAKRDRSEPMITMAADAAPFEDWRDVGRPRHLRFALVCKRSRAASHDRRKDHRNRHQAARLQSSEEHAADYRKRQFSEHKKSAWRKTSYAQAMWRIRPLQRD